MKYLYLLAVCFSLFGCGQKEKIQIIPLEEVKEEKPLLQNFTYEEVAKYAISTIMGQSPSIMSASKDGDLYVVYYVRKSDKQKFTYKLKFNDDVVIWANIDGRWRDTKYDEKIRFTEFGNTLKIQTTYSDGSSGIEKFKK
ncbi:hypothetical protein [Flavobacterium subsaxonicum]|uniref:hypothetical protein n=1 Tax=Flavobacterium subsaxonicum TaxID=426226 RepID=UPI00068621FC|nr:hypothetical protein [Flavobacterium subsaxonicum]